MDGHNGMKPSEANPSTTVHKLVRSLNEYVDWAISILKFIFRFSGYMACNPDNVQFDTSMGTLIGKATVSANSMKEFVFPGVC